MLLAWCCLRQARRMFILQRILSVAATDESFRPRRVGLLREFASEIRGKADPGPQATSKASGLT